MVERKDVDSMKNLMNLMDGVPNTSNSTTTSNDFVPNSTSKDPAMEKFLGSVSTLTEGMIHAANSADYVGDHDHELREAMETKPVNDGVQIGKWKINIREEKRPYGKKTDKFYDIVHQRSGDIIANDLSVYEAAHGIVKLMNKGFMVNSREVLSLMEEDQRFFSHRDDARGFTVRSIKEERRGNTAKQDLYEARLDYSKEQAQRAREKISSIVKTI